MRFRIPCASAFHVSLQDFFGGDLRKTTTLRSLKKLLFYVALIVFLVALLFPLYWMLLTSLRPDGKVMSYPPDFLPTGGGFHAYARVFSRTLVSRWFMNSIYVTVNTLLLAIPLSAETRWWQTA